MLREYYNGNYAKAQLDLDEASNTFSKIADLWKETKPQMRILDIGCGAGSVSGELAKRGHEVCGLDIMAEAVARAKNRGINAEIMMSITFPCLSRMVFSIASWPLIFLNTSLTLCPCCER